MAASAQEQVDQLKSLIDDLEERCQNLRLFDGADEINFHCDDLIGQVTLTVESAMDHLNKVQDRMINEINEFMRQLMDAQGSSSNDHTQSLTEKGLRNLSTQIEMIKSRYSVSNEMATRSKDRIERLRSLIDDLEQRRQDLKLFDVSEEINSHCDDLIGQVTLTVESAVDNLNKVQDRMVNEIDEYRKKLLDAHDSSKSNRDQSTTVKDLMNLSNEIEIIKSHKLPHNEARKLAKNLADKANDLRRQLRAETFGGQFMRFLESGFLKSDIIGRLEKTKRDVQDDLAIKICALDEMVSSSQVMNFRSSIEGPSSKYRVRAILFLHDGNLAVGLDSDIILIWDPVENKKLQQLQKDHKLRDYITALAQLASGHLVIGGNEGSIEIWNLEAQERKFDHRVRDEPILWLKALPDGKLIAFGISIRVWDLADLSEIPTSPAICIDLLGSVGCFAIGYEYLLWNRQGPSYECHFSRHNYVTYKGGDDVDDDDDDVYHEDHLQLRVHMEMLWDGNLAYSCLAPFSDGPTVIVLDINTGKEVRKVRIKAIGAESCVVLPNGDVVICRANNQVEIYSLDDQKMSQSFTNDKGNISIIKTQNRRLLMFMHQNALGAPIMVKDNQNEQVTYSIDLQPTSACFSEDGKRLAIGSYDDRAVMLQL